MIIILSIERSWSSQGKLDNKSHFIWAYFKRLLIWRSLRMHWFLFFLLKIGNQLVFIRNVTVWGIFQYLCIWLGLFNQLDQGWNSIGRKFGKSISICLAFFLMGAWTFFTDVRQIYSEFWADLIFLSLLWRAL